MYYFYRCRKCYSLITRLQFQAAMAKGPEVCSCGSGMVGPTNPQGMEWLKPAVLLMVVMQLAGRLEPAPAPSLPVPTPVGIAGVVPMSDAEKQTGFEAQ